MTAMTAMKGCCFDEMLKLRNLISEGGSSLSRAGPKS
jgi:hypothetical protein